MVVVLVVVYDAPQQVPIPNSAWWESPAFSALLEKVQRILGHRTGLTELGLIRRLLDQLAFLLALLSGPRPRFR